MNYDGLERDHWAAHCAQVSELREKIANRPTIGKALVLPDDGSLSIGEGRRLPMSIMFIDVCGFSQRPMATLEEQDITLRILNLFFSEMIRIAEEYGGTIEKHTGDGLMIYFEDNLQGAEKLGIKRALACALTMHAINTLLISPILQATPNTFPLNFRTSIDHGYVTIARLGLPKRFQSIVAIGAAANFACKMLRLAEPGDIVIGGNARDQLPPTWLQFTQLVPQDTGWTHTSNGTAYHLFKYTGRWSKLI